MGYRVDGIFGDTQDSIPPPWVDEFDIAMLFVKLPENAGPVSEVAFCHNPTKHISKSFYGSNDDKVKVIKVTQSNPYAALDDDDGGEGDDESEDDDNADDYDSKAQKLMICTNEDTDLINPLVDIDEEEDEEQT